MEPTVDISIHPESLRAEAYLVLSALSGGAPTNHASIDIRQIESELLAQYGLICGKNEQTELRMGLKPDPARLQTRELPLTKVEGYVPPQGMYDYRRQAIIPHYQMWNGRPYITSVLAGDLSLIPVNFTHQLQMFAQRSNRGTYCIEGGTLQLFHTIRTIAVPTILLTGILANPMSSADVNDPARWREAWRIAPADRAIARERAEIRLKGGAVATFQRKDQTPNTNENALNKP